MAVALTNLAAVVAQRWEHEQGRAEALYGEALASWRGLDEDQAVAMVLVSLGDLERRQGGAADAAAHYREALPLLAAVGDRRGVADAQLGLGLVATAAGEVGDAVALLGEALATYRAMDLRAEIAASLEGLVALSHARGEAEGAARLAGAALALRAVIDAPVPAAEQAAYDRLLAALGEALGAERFAEAVADGERADPSLLAAEALSPVGTAATREKRPPTETGPAG